MTITEIFSRFAKLTFGQVAAPTAITGTNAVTGTWTAVQIVTADTTVSSITINGTAITAFSGVTLPSGFVFYGNITSITLGAGTAIGYANVTGGLG